MLVLCQVVHHDPDSNAARLMGTVPIYVALTYAFVPCRSLLSSPSRLSTMTTLERGML